jgi:predicted MPP superfamily phosphohydrolase
MSRIWGFLIFLLIFHALYFGMNFYVLARLVSLFGLKRNLVFYSLLAFCTLSLFLANYLERSIGNNLTGIIDFFLTLWMGILFLFFCTLIGYELLHLFVKINPKTAGVVITTIVAILSLYSMLNAQMLAVKVIEVPSKVNMNLIQLTDIHLGSTGTGFLKRIITKTEELTRHGGQAPDAVLITGDLIDGVGEKNRADLRMFDRLDVPIFLSSGNHERYTGIEKIAEVLAETKIRFLRNEVVDFQGIKIIGINDSDDKNQLARQLSRLNLNPSDFTVLMYHRPVGLEAASAAGIDLMLTGHTHNGQIFPFNYIVGIFFKYMSGFFEVNGTSLYVCPGTGTWGPRMRLGSRCEIVLIKLRKDSENQPPKQKPAGP